MAYVHDCHNIIEKRAISVSDIALPHYELSSGIPGNGLFFCPCLERTGN